MKVNLKELLVDQVIEDLDDLQVIEKFFVVNDLESEAIDMISRLSKSKVEKLMQQRQMVDTWACCLPSEYLYENYDLETASKLHTMELNYLINNGELSGRFLKWAEENVPNIKRPEAYFNPLVNWLEDRGIKFKSN